MQHRVEITDPVRGRLLGAAELARLPVSTRVSDRLVELMILIDELLMEFHTEEANTMLWLEPHIEHLFNDVDTIMRRLAQ